MTNKILLLGAGFSKNFGLPLAKEVWSLLFNEPCIQKEKIVRNLMLQNFDYESLFHSIKNGSNFVDQHRICFMEALGQVFKYFENITIQTLHDSKLVNIDLDKTREFIQLFSGKSGGSGYIFSLNQDLFLERLFLHKKQMLVSPYVGNCLWNYNSMHEQLGIKLSHYDLHSYSGEGKTFNNPSDGIMPTNSLKD